jgi:hypothetical protein
MADHASGKDREMQPNFFVIGAMKSGTTTLCDLLSQHPEVFVCDPKEPEFFSANWNKGIDWYEKLFAEAGAARAIGEGSTGYTKTDAFPGVAERIAAMVPHAKLIYLVRHPLERIQSHWLHNVVYEGESRTFSEAVTESAHFIQTSLYWRQLSRYRKSFSDAQILPLFTDDLRSSPEALCAKCFDFLGVDSSFRLMRPKSQRNVTAKNVVLRKKPGLVLDALPFSATLKSILPAATKQRIKAVLGIEEQIRGKPEWDAYSYEYAVEQIRPDSEAFLKYCGKEVDYWAM